MGERLLTIFSPTLKSTLCGCLIGDGNQGAGLYRVHRNAFRHHYLKKTEWKLIKLGHFYFWERIFKHDLC